MDQPTYLFTAAALRTSTAIYVAIAIFLGVALLAELMVRVFGNWLLFFRRFSHRLSFWLGVLGVSVYLSLFLLAQAEPSIRGALFYWERDPLVNRTGVDWLLPALVFGTGLIGCLFYLIALIEWLFSKSDRDNAGDVYKHAKWLFVIERLVCAALLLFFLPGLLIILRSAWAPLTFGQSVLFSYLFLLEKTLDAFTLGFFDSFNVHFVNPGSEVHGVAPYEVWLYLIFVGVVAIPVIVEMARTFYARRARSDS
jgi:hypothetical protein